MGGTPRVFDGRGTSPNLVDLAAAERKVNAKSTGGTPGAPDARVENESLPPTLPFAIFAVPFFLLLISCKVGSDAEEE
jgi:hypothetical protein